VFGSDSFVSVIVPVHNAVGYIGELLDSLVAQDIGAGHFDVTLVDDGSTDGSGELLDAFCAAHPGFRVIHQDNSGRPGRPRNTGLRATSGTYVFFADADDVLAPGCLRSLVAFADQQHSDVVIPKLSPLGGRTFPTAVYERTRIDTDLPTAFQTLFPQKLYRRSLLAAHDIWFPEGRRLDDGIFNARAYVHAERISVLSDGDYYFLRARAEGGQLSQGEKNPSGYTESVAMMAEIVRMHVRDAATSAEIILELYRRKCLNQYGERFGRYAEGVQDAWISAHRSFAERFVTTQMEQRLPSPFQERAYFVRRGDRPGLLALKEVERSPRVTAQVTDAQWTADGLRVDMGVSVHGRLALASQLICELAGGDDAGSSAFPLLRVAPASEYGEAASYFGVLPWTSLAVLVPGTYDVTAVSIFQAERLTARAKWQGAASSPARDGVSVYATKGGNLAVKKVETPSAAAVPGVSVSR